MRNAGNVAALLVLLLSPVSQTRGQITSGPKWIVGGGGGVVFRRLDQSSFGFNLQAGRVIQPGRDFYLEPGLIWQRYWRSPQSYDVCPPDGCPPPVEDAISITGPELRAAYRRPDAANPVHPVAGIGVYRVSSQDTSGVRFGANVGVGISLRRSGSGPGLDLRYFRVFGDSRFRSVIPLALRWSF